MLPISDILDKISHKTKEGPLPFGEYFLSLVVGARRVKAGIWNITKAGGEGLAYGSWESWGGEDAEELIVSADTSIAAAVAKLPNVEGKQPTKVILGLPDFWVEGSAIRKEKLEILQIVCRKLLLKPLGFVVSPEAIAHFLEKEEGGSPSVILVSLDESDITVSLIVRGKFLGSKIVGRSNSLALDLEEGLLRFNFDGVLPSRIVLLGGENLADERQTLISYPWIRPDSEKKLNFLQLPKVEIGGEDLEVSAVILAGSFELGQEAEVQASLPDKKEVKEEPSPELSSEEKVELVAVPIPLKSFGFIEGEDILTTAHKEELPEGEQKLLQDETAETAEIAKNPKIFSKFPNLRKFKFSFGWVKKVFSPFLWLFLVFSKRTFVVSGIILAIFFSAGIFGFWKMAKSEIKIFVIPQKIEKEFEFTVSSKIDAADSEKMVLPAKIMAVEVSESRTEGVTGKKTVGEKATGEVIVYNQTFQTKTLPKGTILKSPGNLTFRLSDEVKVASKTADLREFGKEVYKWGEAKAVVVADEIGAQYNLAADSLFAIDSSFLAKNPSALTGGSSREIQAISKADLENLRGEVNRELEKKGKEEIKLKIASGDFLLEDSLEVKSKIERFDGEVGDEAPTLSLETKATFSVLFLKDEDLGVLFEKITLPLVPAGYQKKPVTEEKNFVVKDKTKGLYLGRIKMEILPEIETGKIAARLKGKTFANGEAYLKGLNQVVGIQILIRPKIFSKLKLFPLQEKNIIVGLEKL